MQRFPIVFLLLVLPAIQCQPGTSPTSGGVSNAGASVDPNALYQELSADLTGPNGILKGMGLDVEANSLLNGLIGPNGTLTSLLGGKYGNILADALRFFLAPDGILSFFVQPDGIFAVPSKVVEIILNSILGPDGIIEIIFGILDGPEERDISTILSAIFGSGGLLQNIFSRIFGQDGVLRKIFNAILGPTGILKQIFNAIFGQTGILGKILGFITGAGKRGTSGGGTTGGNTETPKVTMPAPAATTTGENLNNALCQLEATNPMGELSTLAQTCLAKVTSSSLTPQLTMEIKSLTCGAAGMPTGTLPDTTWVAALSSTDMAELTTFVKCVNPPTTGTVP